MFERFRNGKSQEKFRQILLDKIQPVFSQINDEEQVTTITMVFNFPKLENWRYYWKSAAKNAQLATLSNQLNESEQEFVSKSLQVAFDNFGANTAWHFRNCDINYFSNITDDEINYILFLQEAFSTKEA